MGTVKQLIEASMREILALSEGEEATADQINDGKTILVDLLHSWSSEGMMVPYKAVEVFSPLDTTRNYNTWKPGGNFNSATPIDVLAVSFILSNQQTPLDRMDWRAYMNLPNLAIQSEPRFFLWNPDATDPTLFLDVAPYGGALKVVSSKPLATDFALTDDLEFPDAYNRALRTNLAIDLCPAYQRTASSELIAVATSSKRIVKRVNARPAPSMRSYVPGMRRVSDLPLRNV